MLTFNTQYDIAHGVYLTYDQELDKRLLHSKHKQPTREKAKLYFPYQKWESRKKETFVLACLLVMFEKSPSSFRKMLEELRELDIKDVAKFKHKIINYNDYMKKDVEFLKEKYGNPSPQEVLKEFADKNIEFYTAWWFLKFYKGDFKPGRTFKHIIRKLKFMSLFLTFKESSVEKIGKLLEEIEL